MRRHADALLALASSSDTVVQALDSAELTQEVLGHCDVNESPILEVLSESLLIAGVALGLKALGEFDESIRRMRDSAQQWALDSHEAIALTRQEAMMHQSLPGHIRLLESASSYERKRRREYFRTTKRTLEMLMNRGHYREADALAPSVLAAFFRADDELSLLARVSFLKNIGQLHAARRELPSLQATVDPRP